MLTAEGCRSRRERLWNGIKEDLDAIVIADPMHQIYLANFYVDPFVFRAVNAGSVLILTKDRRSILVADSMVRGMTEQAYVDEVVVPTWYDGKQSAPMRSVRLIEQATEQLERVGGRRWGVEIGRTPAGLVEGLVRSGGSLVPIDAVLHRMKRTKDGDELALLRRSIAAIEAGFSAARRGIHAGMTELDSFHVVERASREALGELMPIYGDFSSGPNTERGGGPPTSRVIEAGDVYLLDYSVVVRGYRGDFANSWIVDQAATGEQRRLYDACLEALSAGEGMLLPGTPCRLIDRAVKDAFARHGLEGNFQSHSGHGLGLGHPDPPYIVADSEDVLMVGDVVTLEPSQKGPGIGCFRTEHNYLITPNGFEQLSHHELSVC